MIVLDLAFTLALYASYFIISALTAIWIGGLVLAFREGRR